MVRKNVSIGVDTWNSLAALGKFGQTFNDIIKILLQEHEELKELKSKMGPVKPGYKKFPERPEESQIKETKRR